MRATGPVPIAPTFSTPTSAAELRKYPYDVAHAPGVGADDAGNTMHFVSILLVFVSIC